ncbi:MAG TPA: hypothetical protein VHG35_11870 [Gemmatimonadales bacterium]|nr:hypothetical protein [Gemmatimonadales bacterium]
MLPGLPLSAQAPAPASAPTARYAAAQLHCARFVETSRSEIETETARGAVNATVEREGIWSFRARDTTGGVALEAWYDSLALRRRTSEGDVVPDTDGLIGGRYRGLLTASGEYAERARPFVPDEVAEVADLSGAGGDLLPRLPPRPLAPGESWGDSALSLTRLQDTTLGGRPLQHFRLESRTETRTAIPRGDTVPIPLRQTTVEEGDLYWSPASGLVRRRREITVEATVPSGGRVRQPARSRVVQQVELTRLPARRPCT